MKHGLKCDNRMRKGMAMGIGRQRWLYRDLLVVLAMLVLLPINQVWADVTLGDATPLIKAVESSNYSEAKNNILAGQNPNSKNLLGKTLVMIAVQKSDLKMLDLLKSVDADLNYTDDHGDTPLMWAVRERKTNSMNWLINQAVDVNAVNNNGETALIQAAKLGFEAEASILLKAGADAGISDFTGRNAKDWANTSRNPSLSRLFP